MYIALDATIYNFSRVKIWSLYDYSLFIHSIRILDFVIGIPITMSCFVVVQVLHPVHEPAE